MVGFVWSFVTFPFRLIGGFFGLVRRTIGVLLGFALMVGGMMASSGGWGALGIPLFIVGAILAARSLS